MYGKDTFKMVHIREGKMIIFLFCFYNELNELSKIFGSEKYLSFQKLEWDVYTKSYLPIVKEFMDEPLKGFDWLNDKRRSIGMGYMEFYNSVLNDLKIKETKTQNIRINPVQFCSIIINYNRIIKDMFKIDERKISKIIYEIPDFFNEESLPKFKGSIRFKETDEKEKEFNLDTLFEWTKDIDINSLFKIGYEILKISSAFISSNEETTFVMKTEFGDIVFGGKGDDYYNGDYILIVDYGGNDIYELSGSILKARVIIDLDGNDNYIHNGFLGPGGSIFGCDILFDLSGNDIYRCGSISIGAGFMGVGFVYNKNGDDFYQGDVFTIGSGYCGIGILFDDEGNDTYRGYAYSEGFGGVLGYGSLIDIKGNDVYSSGGLFLHKPLLPNSYYSFSQGFSIGSRPDYGGGIGLLFDGEGNDFYNAGTYAQGTSYWYSAGFLFDGDGEDFYNAVQYSQGAGIHLSYGLIYDVKGNDVHFSRFGPAMGEGHDFAAGILIDSSGNDHYIVSGGIGIGLNNSAGIFIDQNGNDVYYITEKMDGEYFGIGDVNKGRGFEGIGIFLDLGGNDIYPEGRYKNDFIWSRGVYGIGWDKNSEVKEEDIKQLPVPEFKNMKIDEVFKIASEWGVGENRDRVNGAIEELIRRDDEAIRYIFNEKIGTKNSLEIRAIEEVVKKSKEKAKEYILKCLRDENWIIRRNTINLVYNIELKDAIPLLKEDIMKKENEKILRTYILALGKLKSERKIIENFLNNKKEDVRIASLQALGEINDTSSIKNIVQLLKDPMTTVRSTAIFTLEKYGLELSDYIYKFYREYPEILIACGKVIKDKDGERVEKIMSVLLSGIDDRDDRIRYFSTFGLYYSGKKEAKKICEYYYLKENNKFIKDLMKRIIDG